MMLAYHNNPENKVVILAQLKRHHDADELVKGQYWQNGKGCAVGCTIYSSNHAEYEPKFGIPQVLARLEDTIFEGLSNADAKKWPLKFMGAIHPGADLSRVGWKFLHWLLTDKSVNPGIDHPLVRDAIKQCADVLVPLTKGLPVDKAAADAAARAAADAAYAAADAAAYAAYAARAAAYAAADAAAYAADAAYAAYKKMAAKLIKLLEAA